MPLVRSILSRRFSCSRARTRRGITSHHCSCIMRSRKYKASPLISSQDNNFCHSLPERLWSRIHRPGGGSQKARRTASRIRYSSFNEFAAILLLRTGINSSRDIAPDCRSSRRAEDCVKESRVPALSALPGLESGTNALSPHSDLLRRRRCPSNSEERSS
jgi:hypothetical protein